MRAVGSALALPLRDAREPEKDHQDRVSRRTRTSRSGRGRLLDADNANQTLAELAHAERLRQRLALATGSKAPRSAAPVTESGRARDRRRRADRGRATDLLRQGVSEPVLQALVGHRDARSTRRYARLSDEALVEAPGIGPAPTA